MRLSEGVASLIQLHGLCANLCNLALSKGN